MNNLSSFMKFFLLASSGWLIWKLVQLYTIYGSCPDLVTTHFVIFGGLTTLGIDVACAYALYKASNMPKRSGVRWEEFVMESGRKDSHYVKAELPPDGAIRIYIYIPILYLASNITWGVYVWNKYITALTQ